MFEFGSINLDMYEALEYISPTICFYVPVARQVSPEAQGDVSDVWGASYDVAGQTSGGSYESPLLF